MDSKKIKKALAGLSIAALVVSSGLMMTGCKSSCGAGSCGKEMKDAKTSCGAGSCGGGEKK
jgi:radical SAM modification target selenobiotic family peptide